MRKFLILMLTIFSLIMLVSCGNKDEEAEELIQYNNDNWVPINKMRKEKMNAPQSKLSKLEDEGKDKEAIVVIENEIIPILDDIQNEFKDVELQHKKVKRFGNRSRRVFKGFYERSSHPL